MSTLGGLGGRFGTMFRWPRFGGTLPRLAATAKRALTLIRIAAAARRVAGERGEQNRGLAKRALAGLLGQARGVAMKAGQVAAGFGDREAFRELTSGIEPRPLAEMLPVLERHFTGRRGIDSLFAEIEESRAAASLGQVHRARLHDGTEVAIKVRYPDISSAVRAELELAGLLPAGGPLKRFGFDLGGYKSMLRANMELELDYRTEAERQERFRADLKVPGLVVPEVFRELGGEAVLVQAWETGVDLWQAAGWPRRQRLLLAQTLLATLFTSLFRTGEIHGDPHPGNYFFRRRDGDRPQVVLLDYGCTVPLAESRRLALLKLILDCRRGDSGDAGAAMVAAGFDARRLLPIAAELPALCRILFLPFLVDRPFVPATWNLSDRLGALLGDLRWWFRSAGPPDSVLLIRAFQGLAGQLATLRVALPWWPILERAAGEDLLARARAYRPPTLSAGLTERFGGLRPLARRLRVRATEGDEEVFAVALPALEILELSSLVPQAARKTLHAAGTDLEALVHEVCRTGFRPQEVLSFEDDRRRYRVWLE